jgi:hypothetical protein
MIFPAVPPPFVVRSSLAVPFPAPERVLWISGRMHFCGMTRAASHNETIDVYICTYRIGNSILYVYTCTYRRIHSAMLFIRRERYANVSRPA